MAADRLPDPAPVSAAVSPAEPPEIKQRDGAWFATHKACGWKIACQTEDFALELAAEHRCDPSVSPADTPELAGLRKLYGEKFNAIGAALGHATEAQAKIDAGDVDAAAEEIAKVVSILVDD